MASSNMPPTKRKCQPYYCDKLSPPRKRLQLNTEALNRVWCLSEHHAVWRFHRSPRSQNVTSAGLRRKPALATDSISRLVRSGANMALPIVVGHQREGNRPCAAFRARSVLTAGLEIGASLWVVLSHEIGICHFVELERYTARKMQRAVE